VFLDLSRQCIYNSLFLYKLALTLKRYRKKLAVAALFGTLSIILSNSSPVSYASHDLGLMFGDPVPKISDPNLIVQEVTKGLHLPTHMAFVSSNDILVLEKNNGTVRRVVNGSVSEEPILDVNVATKIERGMLGIAVAKHHEQNNQRTYVFLYFTEASKKDGDDLMGHPPLGNRLYRYELVDNRLINAKLLLDLPTEPGPYHNGGDVSIGPDGYVYLSVGDINGACQELVSVSSCWSIKTKTQNYLNGTDPDGRAGILRLTQDGDMVENGILGDNDDLNLYYAYGIRNSFGIDFDPLTGNLWDTENGPDYGDEINLVKPGFNSGWGKVQGIWEPNGTRRGDVTLKPDHLYDFSGKGKYSKPEFTWRNTVGASAIAFIHSDKYGKEYKDDLLAGDVNNGYLYHFKLNEKRTTPVLGGKLADKIADDNKENKGIVLGRNFGEITDIRIGPDGYVYILVYSQQYGKILRILPEQKTNHG
jgi:glucose/arabinose dehydrogenase